MRPLLLAGLAALACATCCAVPIILAIAGGGMAGALAVGSMKEVLITGALLVIGLGLMAAGWIRRRPRRKPKT